MRAILFLTLALGQAVAPQAPFDPSRWTLPDGEARAMEYLGRPSLFLGDGVALLRDASFGDGTIEFDVALHGHAAFAGVAFRATSGEDYELIYLRTHRSRQWDALQYTPIFGGAEAWQLYSGRGYTSAAELPLNRWVHLKLVVAGYSARLYVDNATEPQLLVTDLKRPWARGQIGVWGRLGGAHFSNVVFTAADSSAPVRATPGAPAPGVLLDWELSPATDTSRAAPDALPPASVQWSAVRAEDSGLLNISQYRRSVRAPTGSRSRDLVFARHVFQESRASRARLVFAYSDAVHVFLNGTPLFAGESAFRSRDPGFLGIASLGPDTLYLDLKAGRNELVFAVTETFGGWGLAARLER